MGAMPNIGLPEIIIVLVIALVIFGPKRLPELGRSLGNGMREFKDSISGTGIQEALDGVGDVRSAMSPTNLAKAAMPASVKEMASDVTDMKNTFADPLGLKQTDEDEAKDESEKPAAPDAAAAPAKASPETPVPPQA